MATLFVYDGGIINNNGLYYTDIFGDELIKRYSFFNMNVEYLMREIPYTEGDENRYSKIEYKNFKFTKLPNICSIKGLVFNYNRTRKIIKNRIKDNNIIIIRLPSFAGMIAVNECKRLKKPYIVELVACPWDSFWNHSIKGKVIAPYLYLMTKIKVWHSPYVIYVTNEFLQRRYPTIGKSISCSNVILNDFDDVVYKNRINKINNLEYQKKIIIGTTAAVNVRYKGQRYVIEALGELKKEGICDIEYQLVGAGNQSFLKSIAAKYNVSNQIVFLGPMPHENVYRWLDTIDIYVQPSRQEGLPRGLIEAMSRGLPAFGARTGGIPELLQDMFIFSNNKKNVLEICNIIKSFDKNCMLNQAEKNYIESKKYSTSEIEFKRKDFYRRFLKLNQLNQNLN